MFRWNFLSPRFYILGTILLVMPVFAQAPSLEFWDYIEEYGDANGGVLDPLEYDQFMNINNDGDLALKEIPPASEQQSINETIDNKKVRNADMKFEKTSSAASSRVTTSMINGAKP